MELWIILHIRTSMANIKAGGFHIHNAFYVLAFLRFSSPAWGQASAKRMSYFSFLEGEGGVSIGRSRNGMYINVHFP